jgi:hypothetical protein
MAKQLGGAVTDLEYLQQIGDSAFTPYAYPDSLLIELPSITFAANKARRFSASPMLLIMSQASGDRLANLRGVGMLFSS